MPNAAIAPPSPVAKPLADAPAETSAGSIWRSFILHVADRDAADQYLIRELPSMLENAAREARRFYFIRFSDNGMQIRLRFRVREDRPPGQLSRMMKESTSRFQALIQTSSAASISFEEVPYDRDALYFGETMKTVYSELLNESSSLVALKLLRWNESRSGRQLILGVCFEYMLTQVYSANETVQRLQHWRAFTAHQIQEDERTAEILPMPTKQAEKWISAIGRLGPQVKRTLDTDPHVSEWIARIRRAERNLEKPGPMVHAMHLFVNKMGYTMQDENLLVRLLQRRFAVPDEFAPG